MVVFLVFGSGCLCSMHRLLHKHLALTRDLARHGQAQNLTRLTIGALVTQLHNGEKFKPYTLAKAIDVISHYLTDVLLLNGFNLRDWNPKYLVEAELADSGLLHDLMEILAKRQKDDECQEEPTGTQTTPTLE
jgi:hypothetical protein